MEFKGYYKILGVEPDADLKAIKTAYRKLARKYHPDVSDHEDAENLFKEVGEAYEVLKDKEKRAEYDEIRQYGGPQGFQPPPGWQPSGASRGEGGSHFQGNFSDFFSSIFGDGSFSGGSFRSESFDKEFRNHRREPFNQKGQDIETQLPVLLEETLSKESKTITYNQPQYDDDGRLTHISKTLKVKIPPGATDGQLIRLKGQGGQGIKGGANGDLYLRIRLVPHPLFDVEGHNLTITLPVSPWEAALGSKVVLPTLTGKINLSIPPNSQSGQRLRVKGKGLPGKQGQGDLYAVLKIVIPTNNSGITGQWQQLAEVASFDPRAEWS